MKTLEEVIDLFDKGCIRPCVECPCYGMKDCQEQLIAESYYLHKYQEIEDEYNELKDWWAEEHAENVPLTWDELKTMEGMPVWVEDGLENGEWYIIECFTDSGRFIAHDRYADDTVFKAVDMGNEWQAYRKERK